MSVVNGKHVILDSDVAKYRDQIVMQECLAFALKSGHNPNYILQVYNSKNDLKLIEIIDNAVNSSLKILVEELNKLIA